MNERRCEMHHKAQEIIDEIKTVVSGKTLDALLPPLIFILANGVLGLDMAVMISLSLSLLLGASRLIRQQTWYYALGGFLGVALATGLAYLTRNPAYYFLSSIVGNGLMFLLALVSQLMGKPLAALASHLTRGWPMGWFGRKDVKPAYWEVTWFWSAFFLLRMTLQAILLQRGDAVQLAWVNAVLGWPVTLIVLVFSYVYGMWRLHHLGGPGVDEWQKGKEPPWRGQVRGF